MASITSSSAFGQGVDVLAVDRRDERAVQALDDLVRQEVAPVLEFLDLSAFAASGGFGGHHLLEGPGPWQMFSAMARKSW